MSRLFRLQEAQPRRPLWPVIATHEVVQSNPEDAAREAAQRAREMLEEASRKYQELLEKAASEAAEMKRRAQEEGYEKGYAAGYEAGLRDAETLVGAAQAALDGARKAFDQMLQEAEPKLLALCLEIAQRVAEQAIEADPEVVLSMVRKGIRALGDEKEFSLVVNPSLVAFLTGSKEAIALEAGARMVDVVGDLSVKHGVIVKSPHGMVDVTVAEQIRNIAAALLEARKKSRRGRDDQFGDP